MPAPPRALVFDLGKVLLDFDYGIAARRLAAHSNLPADAIRLLLDQSPLLLRYEAGELTTREFTHQVIAATHYRGRPEDFETIFGDIFTPIAPMVALHEALHPLLPTYVFSNTNELAVRHIHANFPFFSCFTGHVFSYEHAAMKPNPKLYAVIEQLSGCQGAELVYIDDRPENVAQGHERGWQTILHQHPDRTLATLRQLGLPPPE